MPTLPAFYRIIKQSIRNHLAKIPLFPIPVHISLPHDIVLRFWWCYPTMDVSFSRGRFEYRGSDRAELAFLAKALKADMVFFDIGGYEGLYAVAASRIMRSTGRIVIFEPSKRQRRTIRLNFLFNAVNGTIEPFALSSSKGQQKLFVVTEGRKTTMNSLRLPPDQTAIREELVRTVTLDDYCNKHGIRHIDWLKIDVEGGELNLFKGAYRVLCKMRPAVICEVLDWVTAAWGYPAEDIIGQLKAYDYEWFNFTSDGQLKRHVPQAEYSKICNYLAVPKEKTDWVSEFIITAS